MPGRVFDPKTKADVLATLAANNGNAKKTAEVMGIPRSTVREWAGRNNAHGMTPSPNMREDQRAELGEKWRKVAERGSDLALSVLDGLSPEDLGARDVKDLLISAAVATDKHLLLTGQATSRTETLNIQLVGVADLRNAALSQLASDSESGSDLPIESLNPGAGTP